MLWDFKGSLEGEGYICGGKYVNVSGECCSSGVYGCETWKLNARLRKRVYVLEMKLRVREHLLV